MPAAITNAIIMPPRPPIRKPTTMNKRRHEGKQHGCTDEVHR